MNYSNEQIHTALLKAADQIERHPETFRFTARAVPHICDSPGCALGWTSLFLGYEQGKPYFMAAREAMQLGNPNFVDVINNNPDDLKGEYAFYRRMETLVGKAWYMDASICAKGMRLYAAKYHPLPRVDLPADVRAIFDAEFAT